MGKVLWVLRVLVVLVVAMSIAASTAAAAGLHVQEENGGAPCPAVTYPGAGGETDVDGGCLGHASGEVTFRKHIFGIEINITTCLGEGWGRTDSSGSGYTIEMIIASEPAGPTCVRQACKDTNGEAIPWRAVSYEGTPFGDPEAIPTTQYGTKTFCIEPAGGGADELCEIDSGANETAVMHTTEGGHVEPDDGNLEMPSHGITGFRCEIIAHALSETGGTHDGESEIAMEVLHTS